MRLHSLEHVPFEDSAQIGTWAQAQGYGLSRTRFYANDNLPPVAEVDWLVVMGGPMNIYEEDQYPWLAREKGVSEDLKVRTWHTKAVGDEFGWLLGAAQKVFGALGFPQAAAFLSQAAGGALERAQLDGLLALWHPQSSR